MASFPLRLETHNMVFTQGRGSVIAFWFGRPRTPPLWQRDFFLVNCSQLRRLLASVRSGVVKTFRYVTQSIECPACRSTIRHRGAVLTPRRCDSRCARQRCRRFRSVDRTHQGSRRGLPHQMGRSTQLTTLHGGSVAP